MSDNDSTELARLATADQEGNDVERGKPNQKSNDLEKIQEQLNAGITYDNLDHLEKGREEDRIIYDFNIFFTKPHEDERYSYLSPEQANEVDEMA